MALPAPLVIMSALWVRKGDRQPMRGLVLATALASSYDPIPHTGILNDIFYLTNLRIQVLGWPAGGYYINLIQLIILVALAVVVNFVIEFLTKKKPGGLVTGVLLTVIGAYIVQAVAKVSFDFVFEGVRILASLVGAIVVGVFYTLIRAQFSGANKK